MAGYFHLNANNSYSIQQNTTQLEKIVVGTTGSAWTITIYDSKDSTGAIASNIVGVVTASDGGNYDFECTLKHGLYVTTAGTTPGDATVIYG